MPEFSLAELELVDAPPELSFDNHTRLATCLLDAPISLVSIIDAPADRQFFKSQVGLPEELVERRETPLSHSFCRQVVVTDDMLVVGDSRSDAQVAGNPAIDEFGVAAYLGAPVHDVDGQPIGALCVIDSVARSWTREDIDNLKRLAACVTEAIHMKVLLMREKSRGRDQRDFTYAIAHDLQAPLNTVRLLLNELAGDLGGTAAAPGDGLELHAMARDTLDAADTLIEDVLVYAGSSSRDFVSETIDLNALLAGIRKTLAADIERSGTVLEVADLPCVQGHALQLRMLMQNLISNALKFSVPAVSPRIRIDATVLDRAATITVSDNGIGIAAADHARIFGMFDRLHVERDYAGSGIGLALCRRVVTNHGGTIDVASSPGEGATFRITLPNSIVPALERHVA